MGSLERMYDKISCNVDGDLVIVNNVSTAFALELGFSLFDKADIYRITQMDMSQFNMKMQYYKGTVPEAEYYCILHFGRRNCGGN